jgi:hypothetical protein
MRRERDRHRGVAIVRHRRSRAALCRQGNSRSGAAT